MLLILGLAGIGASIERGLRMGPSRLKALVFAAAVFLVLASLTATTLVTFPALWLWLSDSRSGWLATVRYLLSIAIPVVVGWCAATFTYRCVLRRQSPDSHDVPAVSKLMGLLVPWVLGAYVFGVVFTWVIGVPAVHTHLVREGIEGYHRIAANDPEGLGRQRGPRIGIGASLPLVPFIVVSHIEIQLAPLAGWGGWVFHFWYPGRVRQLGEVMLWMS